MTESPRLPIAVGVVSDTHGLIAPSACSALRGVDYLLHAGDVGEVATIARLQQIAPLVAVRGNIDTDAATGDLPATAVAQIGDQLLYVLHDLQQLDLNPQAAGFAAIVYGHTHQPEIRWQDGILYLNPGSAQRNRWRKPPSVARLTLVHRQLIPEIIWLD